MEIKQLSTNWAGQNDLHIKPEKWVVPTLVHLLSEMAKVSRSTLELDSLTMKDDGYGSLVINISVSLPNTNTSLLGLKRHLDTLSFSVGEI